MNQEQAKELLQRYRMGLCSPEEAAAIGQWYDAMAASGEWSWKPEDRRAFEESLRTGILLAMKEPVGMKEPGTPGTPAPPVIRRFTLSRVAAAAAILLCLASGGYFLLFNKTRKAVAKEESGKQFRKDVLPGGNKAILTLADGSDVLLDSAKNGLVLQQGNAKITKEENGKLAYQPAIASSPGLIPAISYNRLTTPRGGQYQLVLPDGSKVWLNAASSIRYPTAFTGKERRVEISGEAYFEVERSMKVNTPFIVSIISPSGIPGDGGEVEVLGTHFNVNAYGEEHTVKTTLLEGAVKVVKGGGGILLKPGQQAEYGKSGRPELTKDADPDEAIAWKNGIFQFNEAGIETVMRQVERWYDIEVSYEGKIPSGHFSGTVDRNANISQILKILELSELHFKIEGRRIVILPE